MLGGRPKDDLDDDAPDERGDRRDHDAERERAPRPLNDGHERDRERDQQDLWGGREEQAREQDVADRDPAEDGRTVRRDDERRDGRGGHRSPEHEIDPRIPEAAGLDVRVEGHRDRVERGDAGPKVRAHSGSVWRNRRVYPTGSPGASAGGVVPSRCRSIACSSHANRFGHTGHSAALFSGSRPRLVRVKPHLVKNSGTSVRANTRRNRSSRARATQASTIALPTPRPAASGDTASERTSARSPVRLASAPQPRTVPPSSATRKSPRFARRNAPLRSSMRSLAA